MVWVLKLSLPLENKNSKRLEKYTEAYPLGLNYLTVSFSVSWRISI